MILLAINIALQHWLLLIFMHNKNERPQLEGRNNWSQVYDYKLSIAFN